MVEPHPAAQGTHSTPSTPARLLSVVGGLCALVMIALMLWASDRGIEFTDEGYYLISIATPDLEAPAVTQFGFVYHPLFELVGSDIARLRQLNVVLTFGLAWLLSDLVVRQVLGEQVVPRWQRLSVSAAVASGSLALFASVWVLTPSYNGLAFQGLLTVGIGLLLTVATKPRPEWAMLLIGVGGWLTFLAKPTSAVAVGLLIALFAVLARKIRLPHFLGSAAVAAALLVATALAIDGAVPEFITRVRSGADLLSALGGHTPADTIRIDPLGMGQRLIGVSLLIAVTVGLLLSVALLTRVRTRVALACSAVLSGGAVGVLAHGHWGQVLGSNPFRTMVLLSLPLAVGAVAVGPAGRLRPTRAELGIAAVLFLMPGAYVVGTNNNYWAASGGAALLWILAGLVLLGVAREHQGVVTALALLGIATQVLTAALLVQAANKPYRQVDPVRDNRVAAQVGPGGASLRLSADFAEYVDDAREVTAEAGFVPGTPVIDLTGRSPTLVYAIGARSVAQAWMIGGYGGSEKAAVMALDYVDCGELARAWVLTDPGARSIPDTALTPSGIGLAEHYRVAGQWKTASGAAGYPATTQTLWKPARSAEAAGQACTAARGEQNGGTE